MLAIRSVYTNRILSSVYFNQIADKIHRILKQRNNLMMWNLFRRFYWWNDRMIQTGIFVQWYSPFTVRLTDGYTDRTCPLVIPSVKANKPTLCQLSPPLFLLLPPHPNSPLPNCKQPPTPLKISPFSQHKHSSFLYFCTWSQHPFSDLLWILSFFISKLIYPFLILTFKC